MARAAQRSAAQHSAAAWARLGLRRGPWDLIVSGGPRGRNAVAVAGASASGWERV
jgi:hypothetical protein